MKSRLIEKMANLRTLNEKLGLFLPLQQYIGQELSRQQCDLIQEGIYAPTEEDSESVLSEPEQVAQTMCRMLVQAGFQFDHLLKLSEERGMPELELALRTGFLDKMAGQSRAVIDQTIRATRLVTSFFRQFGHMSLEELTKNAKKLEEENTQGRLVEVTLDESYFVGNQQQSFQPRRSLLPMPTPAPHPVQSR